MLLLRGVEHFFIFLPRRKIVTKCNLSLSQSTNSIFSSTPPPKLTQFCFFSFSGLCSVYRSKAGKIPGGEEEEQPCHNSHWLRGPTEEGGEDLPLGGPSRYVGYYDAASLYPASSKYSSRKRERELCFDFFCRSAGGEKAACLPAGFAWGGAGSGPRASHPLGGRRSGAGRQAPRWAGASAAVCRRV